MEFVIVNDLIKHLEKLGKERLLIYDDDGSTGGITSNAVAIWNDDDDDSPVALFIDRI